MNWTDEPLPPKFLKGIQEKSKRYESLIDSVEPLKVVAWGKPVTPGVCNSKNVIIHGDLSTVSAEGILLVESIASLSINELGAYCGIITKNAGTTSHAVIRARAIGKPIVIVSGPVFDSLKQEHAILSIIASEGRGCICLQQIDEDTSSNEPTLEFLNLFRERSKVAVWATIDDAADAQDSTRMGADGIGMWRLENFVTKKENISDFSEMWRRSFGKESRRNTDFSSLISYKSLRASISSELFVILKTVAGRPVLMRLLDPPLADLAQNVELRSILTSGVFPEEHINHRLLVRGVRTSVIFPWLLQLQIESAYQALQKAKKDGVIANLAIMVPYFCDRNELLYVKRVFDEKSSEYKLTSHIKWAANIETPRSALSVSSFAQEVSYFSFGTNDMTELVWGLDREYGEMIVIDPLQRNGILMPNPFTSFDEEGVGQLMRYAIDKGRAGNSSLTIGVSGEMGGKKSFLCIASKFGIDYVTVSRARITDTMILLLRYA